MYSGAHCHYKHNPGLHVLKKSKTKSQLTLMTNRDGPKKSVQALVCAPTFVRGCVLHCCCNAAEASIFCGTCPEVWMRPGPALLTVVCNLMLLAGSWIVTAEAGRDAGRRIWAPAWTGCRVSGLIVWWLMMNRFWGAKWHCSATSSCLTNTGRPGELQDAEQFDGVLFSSLIWMGARGLSWGGESPCWHLFSDSSCIFSSSTSLCSCSSFLISSSIWRSFSWRRLSLSESLSWGLVSMGHSSCGARCGELTQGAVWVGDTAFESLVGLSAILLSSMPSRDTLEAIGDTGGVNFMFSDCEAAVTAVVSMEAVVWMLEFSWYCFSRSIRSVLVPETGKDLSFSSVFSSATCKDNRSLFSPLHYAWGAYSQTVCRQQRVTFISSRLAGKWSGLWFVWMCRGCTHVGAVFPLRTTLGQLVCTSVVGLL